MTNFKTKLSEEANKIKYDDSQAAFEFGAQWAIDEVIRMLNSKKAFNAGIKANPIRYADEWASWLEAQVNGESE